MHIYRHLEDIEEAAKGGVLALGTFDGFHRGHQEVIARAGRIAWSMKAPIGIFTTEPHPRLFFKPDQEPFLLTPFRAKVRHLEAFGLDFLFAAHFDTDLAKTSAEDFIQKFLIDGMCVRHLVVGYNYRFGQGRRGNVEMLRHWAEKGGYEVSVIDPVSIGVEGAAGEIYSSTLIRQTLKDGHARRAAALLGHWWTIEGHVQKGDQRGRLLGFPTINVPMDGYLRPRFGVYAVRVRMEDTGDVYDGVANIGRRPTFDKQDVLLEAHIFGFNGDIYGKSVAVQLVAFIRSERKFNGLDEIKAQIAIDCKSAKLLLNDPDNAADRFPAPHLDAHEN